MRAAFKADVETSADDRLVERLMERFTEGGTASRRRPWAAWLKAVLRAFVLVVHGVSVDE